MKKTNPGLGRAGCAVLLSLAITQNQPAFAGWSGLINGLGKGWASVNVSSSTFKTNKVTTANNLASPSAAMAPTAGYKVNAPLPEGASPTTFSRIKGLPGGIWQAAANAAVGDGTDNAELQSRITVTPADCASLTFTSRIVQSQAEFSANGNSGTILVNATATAGTALWLRGFEYTGSMDDVPLDNPDTVENESIEYLKQHGVAIFDTLGVGPFNTTSNNSGTVSVPFTLSSSNLEHFIFAADGVTLSLPLVVVCPPSIVVSCAEPFSYPPVQYGGCGDIAITYSPARPASGVFPAGVFPIGVTPVTVTATDTNGHSTNCTFTVTVTDTTAPVAPALATIIKQCSATVPVPAAWDACAGYVNGTTSDPLTYNSQGTFTVHWTFNDGRGNSSTANQTVIVKDTTPPVAPVLPSVSGICSAPVSLVAPTTTDNCAGTVTGTTTNSLSQITTGTNKIYWTFSDGNGNSTTVLQKVIVKGLKFEGFESPISGTGGSCGSPKKSFSRGCTIPVEFEVECDDCSVRTGNPTLLIEKSDTQCTSLTSVGGGNFILCDDEWRFNWNTSSYPKATYKLTATLQDGSKRTVWIKLK